MPQKKDKIVPRNLGTQERKSSRGDRPHTKGSASSPSKSHAGASSGHAHHKGSGKGYSNRSSFSREGRPSRPARDARFKDKRRAPSGGALIEGRRATEEALDAGVELLRAYVTASTEHDARLDVLIGRLEAAGVELSYVTREKLDALSSHGAHQGIVAETKSFSYTALTDVLKAVQDKDNVLILLLDHVSDEGNFGAICRSAEVVGASAVVVANARAARVGVGAYKTSAGAVLRIPIVQVSNLAQTLDELKAAGFWVAGASEHAQTLIWDAPISGKLVVVMGSEGEGISRLVLEKCDFTCKLPQTGKIESLNVAQAATVFCYEWLRRTQTPEQ